MIKSRLNNIRKQIKTAEKALQRKPDSVQLIAVSKAQPVSAIEEAIIAGQTAFAENYVQEALDKINALAHYPLQWHFIGTIQSNKCQAIAEHFSWVHSVTRAKIADQLNRHRPEDLPPLNVCLQINISLEKHKQGVSPTELDELAEHIQHLPRLTLRGLMGIPAITMTAKEHQVAFLNLKQSLLSLNRKGHQLDTLSMGMSNDFMEAIAAGSTMLRIGQAIFGPRIGSVT